MCCKVITVRMDMEDHWGIIERERVIVQSPMDHHCLLVYKVNVYYRKNRLA